MKPPFTTANKLLTEGSEQSRDKVCAAKHGTMLHVWIGRIGTLLNFDCDEQFKTWISATEDRYLFTNTGCSVQTDHKDFPVRKNASSGHFFLIKDDDEGKLYVLNCFYPFSLYPREALCKISDLLVLVPVVLSSHSVLAGHGYLQHSDAGYL